MSGGARLPGIGSHHSAASGTDDWLTPPGIIDRLGPFDLDPCTPAVMPWETAFERYTPDDDGLALPWRGRVWLNPPYSNVDAWMRRLREHGTGTALVFARTETAWWFDEVWGQASAVLFIRGWLTFLRADGSDPRAAGGGNSGAPSALVAYGYDDARLLERAGIAGAFIRYTETLYYGPRST